MLTMEMFLHNMEAFAPKLTQNPFFPNGKVFGITNKIAKIPESFWYD